MLDLAVSPNGEHFLSGGADGIARIWDSATLIPIGPPLYHNDAVTAVAFSKDGRQIITGSRDETAQTWHVDVSPLAGSVEEIGELVAERTR